MSASTLDDAGRSTRAGKQALANVPRTPAAGTYAPLAPSVIKTNPHPGKVRARLTRHRRPLRNSSAPRGAARARSEF